MMRILTLCFVFGKYTLLYLFTRLGLYNRPKHKILRNFFEDAGGSFIKLGQLLALRTDLLPDVYAQEMLELLDSVKPFPIQFVEEIFMEDFGVFPQKIFKEFQPTPFASASFGQVHLAKQKDGTVVAIKIQRPGIAEKVAIDFFIVDVLAYFGDMFFSIKALPWREFAKEFKEWTRKELNYIKEAENADRMYQNCLKIPHVVIPKTYISCCSRRILVQEYIEGFHVSRILQELKTGTITPDTLKQSNIDIRHIPSLITQELLRQYFFDGFAHADMHPGNIILLPAGKIALIDFGIMTEWISEHHVSFIRFMKHVGEGNFKKATYYFADVIGDDLRLLVQSAFPILMDQKNVDDFMQTLSQHFSGSVEKTVQDSAKDMKNMKTDYAVLLLKIFQLANHYKIKAPKEMAIFIKALATLGLVSKQLNPEYKLQKEIQTFFNKHTEASFPKPHVHSSLRHMSREVALERFNDWLGYLLEVDPSLYTVVDSWMTTYNQRDQKL